MVSAVATIRWVFTSPTFTSEQSIRRAIPVCTLTQYFISSVGLACLSRREEKVHKLVGWLERRLVGGGGHGMKEKAFKLKVKGGDERRKIRFCFVDVKDSVWFAMNLRCA